MLFLSSQISRALFLCSSLFSCNPTYKFWLSWFFPSFPLCLLNLARLADFMLSLSLHSSLLQPGNCLPAHINLDNSRAHLAYFSSFMDHSPILLFVQCLKIAISYILSDFLVVYDIKVNLVHVILSRLLAQPLLLFLEIYSFDKLCWLENTFCITSNVLKMLRLVLGPSWLLSLSIVEKMCFDSWYGYEFIYFSLSSFNILL